MAGASNEMPDGCVIILIAMAIGIFILGPLGTGIGLIFCSFLQAVGIGLVSCIVGGGIVAAILSWAAKQ